MAFIDARFGVAVFSIHAVCRRCSFAPTPVPIAFQLSGIIPCVNCSILEKLLISKIVYLRMHYVECGVDEKFGTAWRTINVAKMNRA